MSTRLVSPIDELLADVQSRDDPRGMTRGKKEQAFWSW